MNIFYLNKYFKYLCDFIRKNSPNYQLAFNLESVDLSLLKTPEIAGKITDRMPS